MIENKTNVVFDCLIIGEGPAGMSAALYLKRFSKNIAIIASNPGGQVVSCGQVDNYLGFFDISGAELFSNFDKHLEKFKIKKYYVRVEKIEKNSKGIFECFLSNNKKLESKTVLLTTGSRYKKLNIKGEEEFSNIGVSYCTICDAFFFLNKKVAIIGGGNSALDSGLILKEIAEKVYIINKNNFFKNADQIMLDILSKSENVDIIYNAVTTSFNGTNELENLTFIKDNKEQKLDVSGAFINIGQLPNTDFLSPEILNVFGEIISNQYNETIVSGMFCAGDVKEGSRHQIVIAAGDGANAAININEYLKKKYL